VCGIHCIALAGGEFLWPAFLSPAFSSFQAKPGDARTTVFRFTGEKYLLKMKASRALFKEVSTRFTAFPFSLRAVEVRRK
jgi:hypothetical protein